MFHLIILRVRFGGREEWFNLACRLPGPQTGQDMFPKAYLGKEGTGLTLGFNAIYYELILKEM
jgi:hypothetical protein